MTVFVMNRTMEQWNSYVVEIAHIDESRIINHELIKMIWIDREGLAFVYQFVFQVALEGTSYDY